MGTEHILQPQGLQSPCLSPLLLGWSGCPWCPRVPYGPTRAGQKGADPAGLAQVRRKVYKPSQEGKGGCWDGHVGLLACGLPQTQEELCLAPWHTRKPVVCHFTGWEYTTFSHWGCCSYDSICPYQLITSANEPGIFNLPFISPQVRAH